MRGFVRKFEWLDRLKNGMEDAIVMDMRIIIVRSRAQKSQIEITHVTNDDVAQHKANILRAMDVREEYWIDILIPEDWDFMKSEFENMTSNSEV